MSTTKNKFVQLWPGGPIYRRADVMSVVFEEETCIRVRHGVDQSDFFGCENEDDGEWCINSAAAALGAKREEVPDA